jgi:hypothetical protein
VRTCKRGHLRVPENTRSDGGCRVCHRVSSNRYHATKKGLAAKHRYNTSRAGLESRQRYNASFKGWAADQRFRLKSQREAIEAKLESLKKEEAEACRKLAALLIATK